MAIKTKAELTSYINTYINTNGTQSITGAKLNTLEIDMIDSLAFLTDIDGFEFNTQEGVYDMETDTTGVVNQLGLEDWYRVINNSGSTINNGDAVYLSGVDATDDTLEIELASNSATGISSKIIGLVTSTIADGSKGFVTSRGYVRDFDTSALDSTGPVYLGTSGALTMTKPTFPATPIIIGELIKDNASTGIMLVKINRPQFQAITKSYNFTSNGVAAGTYYLAGYYDAYTNYSKLNQTTSSTTWGTSNIGYSAHAFIVCGGAGAVDTGVIGLRVNGTSIDDHGTRTASDTETILADITTTSLDEYYEAKKFIGQVTFELFVVSGTPTTYSLDFNYGFAKYEDFGNKDFTLNGFEVVGLAGASDSIFDVQLYEHSSTGWTFAESNFVPGGDVISSSKTTLGTESNLLNGSPFAFKRTGLATKIEGSGSEGLIVKITTGANGSVQSMDTHIGVVLD